MPRLLAPWLFAAACSPSPGGEAPPACATDADCDDGNGCTGSEVCDPLGACVPGEPVACDAPAVCSNDAGAASCVELCALPDAPVLEVLAEDESLPVSGASALEVDGEPVAAVDVVGLVGPVEVVAVGPDPGCVFDHVYDVQPAYPGPAGSVTGRAVPLDDGAIVAWATSAAPRLGPGVDDEWRNADEALGPAEGTSTGVLSLGEGGSVVLGFERPLADGPGADLLVFENSFDDDFLELAYVEVSSDGTTFARFDAAARTPEPVGPFDLLDPTQLHGLAGVVRQGWGAPFNLALLRHHALTRTGQLDLQRVRYVRLVDVVGDGRELDAFGRPIHDPTPTTGSAGFDVDAVGVLHEATP